MRCLNESGCDGSFDARACLLIAYEASELSSYLGDACSEEAQAACAWDADEFASCTNKLRGIQSQAQAGFEACLLTSCDVEVCSNTL